MIPELNELLDILDADGFTAQFNTIRKPDPLPIGTIIHGNKDIEPSVWAYAEPE